MYCSILYSQYWKGLIAISIVWCVVFGDDECPERRPNDAVLSAVFGQDFNSVIGIHELNLQTNEMEELLVNTQDFAVHPIGFFETTDKTVSKPGNDLFFSFDSSFKTILNTGSRKTCFSARAVKRLVKHNKSWDIIVPQYPYAYNLGGAYLTFGVNMWFHIDGFNFAMPVYYGCNVDSNDIIFGLDFLHNINPLQRYEFGSEKLIILSKSNAKTKTNFLDEWHDEIDGKNYWRPNFHTLVNIKKYYQNDDQKDFVKNWTIWEQGTHYLRFRKSLSFSQIRAFTSLASNIKFFLERSVHKEPAEPATPLDDPDENGIYPTIDSDDIWLYFTYLVDIKIKKFPKKRKLYGKKYLGSFSSEATLTQEGMDRLHAEMLKERERVKRMSKHDHAIGKQREIEEIDAEIIPNMGNMIHLSSYGSNSFISVENMKEIDAEMRRYMNRSYNRKVNAIKNKREIDEVHEEIYY